MTIAALRGRRLARLGTMVAGLAVASLLAGACSSESGSTQESPVPVPSTEDAGATLAEAEAAAAARARADEAQATADAMRAELEAAREELAAASEEAARARDAASQMEQEFAVVQQEVAAVQEEAEAAAAAARTEAAAAGERADDASAAARAVAAEAQTVADAARVELEVARDKLATASEELATAEAAAELADQVAAAAQAEAVEARARAAEAEAVAAQAEAARAAQEQAAVSSTTTSAAATTPSTTSAATSQDGPSADVATDDMGADDMDGDYDMDAMMDDGGSSGGSPSAAATRGSPSAAAAGGSPQLRPPSWCPDCSANTFEDYGVNPFVSTDEDPLSTFALDVDTASFVVARNFLRGGMLPPPEAVRVEEFVNYFDGGYEPVPDEFVIDIEAAPSPFASDGHVLLRVGVRAPDVLADVAVPRSIVVVMDRSGSMGAAAGYRGELLERIELAHQAVDLLLGGLPDGTRVGIVSYDDQVDTVVEPTDVAGNREKIMRRIRDEVYPRGSTNAEAGLARGYEMALAEAEAGWSVLVMLLSDGVANVGATRTDEILSAIGDAATSV